MKYKSDTKYSEYSLDLQLIEANTSTLYIADALSNMKFKTMGQYRQAMNVKQATRSIIEDMTYVNANKSNYQLSLTRNTWIGHNLDVISRNASILQQGKDVLTYEKGGTGNQLQLGIAYLDRAGKNFLNKNTMVHNYRYLEGPQKLQQKINHFYGTIYKNDEPHILKHLDTLYIKEKAINIAVPRLLIYASAVYRKQSPIIQGALETVGNIMEGMQGQLENMGQKLTQWGDIKQNPFGQIVGVMDGLQSIITSSYSITSIIYGSLISDFGKGIAEQIFSEDDSNDSVKSSILGTLTRIFKTLGKLITGLMNLAVQGIQLSLESFINIMATILNLVKSIIKSSPVFEQILNYLQLALSLFFLPFFTSFGMPLLEAIMGIVSWVVSEPRRLMNQFLSSVWSEKDITNFINTILEQLNTFLDSIDKEQLYSSVAVLVENIQGFISSFFEAIIDNSQLISEFIKDGLNLFNDMVRNGIIKDFIDLSTLGMNFIIDNINDIFELLETIFKVVESGLEVFGGAMSEFYSIMNIVFIGLGALQGQMTAKTAQEVITLITGGVGAITIPEAMLQGAAVGAGIGESSWLILENQYIKKDWLTYYENYEIPNQDSIAKFAEGGKIYRRNGGTFGIIQEAGEGEWAIPKSKAKLFRGNNNVIIRINGKTYNKQQIDSALRELEPMLQLPFGNS